MIPRSLSVAAVLLAAAAAAAEPPAAWWLQVSPRDAAEVALRRTLDESAFAGLEQRLASLEDLAARHPGTTASGLARLAAGLALLEANRGAESVPHLRHPDVARTALADRAARGLGRALESSGDPAAAALAYLSAAGQAPPGGAVACPALRGAAEALRQATRVREAVPVLERALAACPAEEEAGTLLLLARAQEASGQPAAAAATYDRLERDHPAAAESREAQGRLRALAAHAPKLDAAERARRELGRAEALLAAGRSAEAASALRLLLARPAGADTDLVRLRLGQALLARRRDREAVPHLAAVAPASSSAAEAAYELGRSRLRVAGNTAALEAVPDRFPGTRWAEESLVALLGHHQRERREAESLPIFQRLLREFPGSRLADRAAWKLAFTELAAGRPAVAAEAFEKAARARPASPSVRSFLYWSGRAAQRSGDPSRARLAFLETVARFKHTYHGQLAASALRELGPGPAIPPPVLAPAHSRPPDEETSLPLERTRQLLLVDRLDEALEELRLAPSSPRVEATTAWILWRRGRLRPAINAMRRAYPEHASEAGDRLPDPVWRILFPLEYADAVRARASDEEIDPALLAALVCQESTFDAAAVSRAGAQGLMQIMPATGRSLARRMGIRLRPSALRDPQLSLRLGTRYFRGLLERFGGRPDLALAAYNAGPSRVVAWTGGRLDVPSEEFVEGIPFTETRNYVMAILASREEYRRLYGLGEGANR